MQKIGPISVRKPKARRTKVKHRPNPVIFALKLRALILAETLAVAALAIVLKVSDPAVWGFLGAVIGYTMAKNKI